MNFNQLETVFPLDIGVIHIIGIGGIGMSGLAEILHSFGYQVQGSDMARNYITSKLEARGVRIFIGHDGANVEGCALVVQSTAVSQNNPEIIRARELRIPIIKRSEMLAELMRFKNAISISGTHGKTTTTSLIGFLLENAGFDPTVINGGIINHKQTNAYIGNGPYLVVEADESDGTFIRVPSYVGIITNIDPEHLDFYKTFEASIAAYRTFIASLPFYGFGVLCYDHPIVRQLGMSIKERKIVSYGVEYCGVDIRASNISTSISEGSTFDVHLSDAYVERHKLDYTSIEGVKLAISGYHNVSNTLAAIAVGIELGITKDLIANVFSQFQGVKRRFTHVEEVDGISIVDDYAHHPVEIIATLATAKDIALKRGGRVIAVMQPHRYSRLYNLMHEFSESFHKADFIIVTPVYAAGEQQIPGATSLDLLQKISYRKNKSFECHNIESCAERVNSLAQSGDIVIFLGAGDITKWAYDFPEKLRTLRK